MGKEQIQTAPPSAGETNFIDQAELLKRLPVSRRTLHNWRTSGKIPSIKIGRRVLFCWENVAEALRRLERGGSATA
jgi:excisionase family DNA binding protein